MNDVCGSFILNFSDDDDDDKSPPKKKDDNDKHTGLTSSDSDSDSGSNKKPAKDTKQIQEDLFGDASDISSDEDGKRKLTIHDSDSDAEKEAEKPKKKKAKVRNGTRHPET